MNYTEFSTELIELPRKKKHYIYLAGNISDDPRTYEWRDEFTNLLKDNPNLVIVNPCANKFNQSIKNVANSGLEFTKKAVKLSQKLLRAKDYQLIKMCSIVVVHLGYVSPDKPLIGTIQELVWAHDIFYIPVIAITNGEDNVYTNHSWIDECCSAKVETLQDAVNIIYTFFNDY